MSTIASSIFTTTVLLVALSIFAAPAAAAQAGRRLEGRVVDEASGSPVAGASVSIPGVRGTAKTDENGRFTWAPAPPVPFHVVVVLAGGQVAKPIAVDALDEGVTSFRVRALADESLTVIGAAPSIEAAPASGTTILSGTQIALRDPGSLMQALETVPGVGQISEGHAAAPAVRGLARGRTLFLVDGGRVSSERRAGPSAAFIDPSVIEGIDIARGPGSVAYGSDALGGVISVRTRRAAPNSPWDGRASVTVGAGVPETRGSVEVSKGTTRGGVLVQTHARHAGDYESPQGDVFNSGWNDRGFLVNATHAIGSGFLAASWQSDFGRDIERPRSNSRDVRVSHPLEDSHRVTASYELPQVAGFRQVTVTGFAGAYEQRTDQERVATASAGRSLERADISASDFHVKGTASRIVRVARLELGVDVNGRYNLRARESGQEFDVDGSLVEDSSAESIEDARRIDTGVYAQAEALVSAAARLSGGVRVDRVTTRNVGGFFGNRSTAHEAMSGFAALSLGVFHGFSVTGQVSRGFRDPVLSDRYFRGPSGRGFTTGNPELEPETSLQLDLAARYTISRTRVAVYVYHYRISDLVERYQSEPDFFTFRNRGRAQVRGLELEASSELGRGYSVEIGGHLARGRALEDRAHLDDVSPDALSLLVRKQFRDAAYVQARVGVAAEDMRPGPSEVAAPGARVVDIAAGWPLLRQLDIRGSVRNLLNEEYYGSPDPRWVLAAGRSVAITTVVKWK